MGAMFGPIIKFFLIVFAVVLIPWFIIFGYFVWDEIRHGGEIKRSHSRYKKISAIKRLFIDFPKILAYDFTHRNPDEFSQYGVHLFCGEQGSGKTVSVVELIQRMKLIYPNLKSRSNIRCDFCDGHFDTWQELCNNDNGVDGQIEFVDEMHNWFTTANSINFPPAMLSEITQQRKQRKMIVGTTQVFGRLCKQLRQEATFVYLPMTFLGCLTIVRVSKPCYYSDEKAKFTKYIRTYFFVHNLEIREAFDTYEKVENILKKGFVPRSEQLKDVPETKVSLIDKK